MWGITHLCNRWEGLAKELVKPRGPSPRATHPKPPTSPGSHLPEAPPSPLYSTALRPPPDQRSTRGKQEGGTGLEFRVAVGQGVPRPPTGAPCQAQPGPRARAAHTVAPTESRWEMQTADSGGGPGRDGHHGPQPWASTHPCEPQVFMANQHQQSQCCLTIRLALKYSPKMQQVRQSLKTAASELVW